MRSRTSTSYDRGRPSTTARTSSTVTISELRLEPARDLSVPADRNEVNPVEHAGLAELAHQVAGERDTGVTVLVDALDDLGGDGELRDVAGELAGHGAAGDDDHAGEDRTGELDGRAPFAQRFDGERDL